MSAKNNIEEQPLFRQIVADHKQSLATRGQKARFGGDGFIVIVVARGDWCPFCRTWALQWQQRRQIIEENGGSLVIISSQEPALIPINWAKASSSFSAFDSTFYQDPGAALGEALGVVVEEPINHKEQYPSGKIGQPGAFIFALDGPNANLLVQWTHAPRAANLHGAIGRADVDTLLNEGLKRLQSSSNTASDPKIDVAVDWSIRPIFRMLVDNVVGRFRHSS